MAKNLLFILWSLTLIVLLIYIQLVVRGVFTANDQLLTNLILVNFIGGLIFLVVFFFQFIERFWKIGIMITVGFLIYLYFLSRAPSVATMRNLVFDIKNTYLNVIYDFFGYPYKETMATSDELWQAINIYRETRGLPSFSENADLCDIADQKLTEMLAISYTNRLESIKEYPYENLGIKQVTEILLTSYQPLQAQNIINHRFNRPLSPVKQLLEDDGWKSGCVAISGQSIALILGK